MSNDLLCRGWSTDYAWWFEGYYVHLTDQKGRESHRIYTGYAESDCGEYYPDWFEVDPATVGRFAGLEDRNGKRIFEGDLVIPTNRRRLTNKPQVVKYDPLSGYWQCAPARDPVVIGNIRENPELLEVNEDD